MTGGTDAGGPRDGRPQEPSYGCDPHGTRRSDLVNGDTIVRFVRATEPAQFVLSGSAPSRPETLAAFDQGMGGGDLVFSVLSEIASDGLVVQFD